MSIIRKVKAVERVFKSLDEEINQFKKISGLHCLPGCGKCCTKPDIHASPLEFFPLAFDWFRQGLASQKLELLDSDHSTICFNYSPLSLENQDHGSCSSYVYRGLICRLFGYAAMRDKNGQLKLVTCKPIKEDQAQLYEYVRDNIDQMKPMATFSDYYKKLYQIDFRLANEIYPINKAIQVALEEIMHYYAYRPFSFTRRTG